MFKLIVLSLIAVDLCWWRWLDKRLAAGRGNGPWRVFAGLFVAGVIFFPIAASRMGHYFPAALPAAALLWHLLVLPAAVFLVVAAKFGKRAEQFLRRFGPRRQRLDLAPTNPVPDATLAPRPGITRRQLITAAAVAAPPMLTAGLTRYSLDHIGEFRVRALDVPVPGWPAALAGFTIAHVADVHTGPFSTPKMLADVVERTNTIHRGGPADMVVFAGDLINTTLHDLPAGLEMAKALRSRLGTFACMGNHDVMDSEKKFRDLVGGSGIPLLVDEALTVEARPGVFVQLLGIPWKTADAETYRAVAEVAAKRDPRYFPILLAHHPHAWDEAARRDIPLVLSGHTHGGQIMLTKNIGAGPLKFRYWTGAYARRNSTLVVSNGVGNWFPLRVNAPAEILKLTLRPA